MIVPSALGPVSLRLPFGRPSPNDYLQRLRVETAQGLLLETDLAVTAVAGEVGFDTSQYFAAVFKKYTGQTPTAFRRQQDKA